MPSREVIWHDLECGSYSADLALWRELAERARRRHPHAAILEIGAGTGRVSLDLARRGHTVWALERDPVLLGALTERAGELPVRGVCADAREFDMAGAQVGLCLVPMQTLQLLGGPQGRGALLARVRAHLRPGALLACAIATELEEFDSLEGEACPSPELWVAADGTRYLSQPLSLSIGETQIRIERRRSVIANDEGAACAESTRDVVELDRVNVPELLQEARSVGFRAAGPRTVPATARHAGSEVVLVRA